MNMYAQQKNVHKSQNKIKIVANFLQYNIQRYMDEE